MRKQEKNHLKEIEETVTGISMRLRIAAVSLQPYWENLIFHGPSWNLHKGLASEVRGILPSLTEYCSGPTQHILKQDPKRPK